MATTPLSDTQIRDNYPFVLMSPSVDPLTNSDSSKLGMHPSCSGQRHCDNESLSSTSTTRRDDDPSHNPRNNALSSNSSHGSNPASPSKYSNTWLVRNDRGEQVNLPRHPYSWSPPQLALYLAGELHAHDGTSLDWETIQSMTEFVQDFKISGRVFLFLDQEDFHEMYDLDPFWRNAMWDAAYTLRKRALPYKRSRASSTVIGRANVRSIMEIFGESFHETGDTKPIVFQQPPVSSGDNPEQKDGENEMQILPADDSHDADLASASGAKIDTVSFGNLEVSLSPKAQPDVCQVGQPIQIPELVPVLPPLSPTPTDVILNEVPEMPHSTSLYQRPSISQDSHGSPFPVFQEPEDAPDEISLTSHRSINVVSTPASQSDELRIAEGCAETDGERSTTSEDMPVEAEEQVWHQDSTTQLLPALQKGKDKASEFNHITPYMSQDTRTLTEKLHHAITNLDLTFIKPQTESERETLQTIEVLRTRLIELESRLEIMEKASLAPGTAYPYVRQKHRHSPANFDGFPDDETGFPHRPCTDLTEVVFNSAANFEDTRSWQNALILLAGATTGVTVILIPGLLRHFWNKW